MRKTLKIGVVHGRLQPLHNDHLKYFLAGFEHVDLLYIGITNPDPSLTSEDKADVSRSRLISNPCTYYERLEMVDRTLLGVGIQRDSFRVVPFPINFPELFKHYVPEHAVHFLTIYDRWGDRKKELLESAGFDVHVLWRRSEAEKGISSTGIRDLISAGGEWENLVPLGAADVIKQYGIDERIRNIGHRHISGH